MVATWAILSILAALFWAISNNIDKYIFSKWIKHKHPYVPILILGLTAPVLVFFQHSNFACCRRCLCYIRYFLCQSGANRRDISRSTVVLPGSRIYSNASCIIFRRDLFAHKVYWNILTNGRRDFNFCAQPQGIAPRKSFLVYARCCIKLGN